jgi:hypothetical protein
MAVWRNGQGSPDAPFLTATSVNVANTVDEVIYFTANQASPVSVSPLDLLVATYYAVTDGSYARNFTLTYNEIQRRTKIQTTVTGITGDGTIDHQSTLNRDKLGDLDSNPPHPAKSISTLVTGFNNNLSASDTTVQKALDTVDVATGEAAKAINQRSDVCAVPAAGVVGEAMMALVLAASVLEKFGGDSVEQTRRNYESYMSNLRFK